MADLHFPGQPQATGPETHGAITQPAIYNPDITAGPVDAVEEAPRMLGRRDALRGLLGLGLAAATGAVIYEVVSSNEHKGNISLAPPETTVTTGVATTEAAEAMNPDERFKSQLSTIFQGFDTDKDLLIGDAVKWDGAPEERGTAAFTRHTLRSGADFANWVNSSDPRAGVAHNYFEATIGAKIAAGSAAPEERDRIFNGEAFRVVQIADHIAGAAVEGTSHIVDGKIVISPEARLVGRGDAFLIYADKAGNVDASLTERCDCGNPHVTRIRPLVPGEKLKPVEVPPKIDDGILPGDPSVPADQDHGTPDRAGIGPAEQPVDPVTGTIKTETTVAPPATTATTAPPAPTTSGRPPATTAPAPTSTNPPVPATTSVATTTPQTGPLPTQP